MRVESQLKRSAIETLRFATGDEALCSEIYAKHGDTLYTKFGQLRPEIEAWLKWDDKDANDESDDEDSKSTKKAVPEKRRKRLLDTAT